MAHELDGLRHITGQQGLADLVRTDSHCIHHMFGNFFQREAVYRSQFFKGSIRPLAVPAKMVVMADDQGFHPDSVDEDIPYKFHRAHPGKSCIEFTDDEVIDTV